MVGEYKSDLRWVKGTADGLSLAFIQTPAMVTKSGIQPLLMNLRENLAIIGSGASAIYLLKHLLDEVARLRPYLRSISLYEKNSITGMGMPYSPQTTDRFNMSNISSEELPPLEETLAEWLRAQNEEVLRKLDLWGVEIQEDEVYSRLALGSYLNAQYRKILARLAESGITIHEHAECEIIDVMDYPQRNAVAITTAAGEVHEFEKVVIATGHYWGVEDRPQDGYYASPWPISKLLPAVGEAWNFPIGTLGASLSAFDVIASLSHRHGEFIAREGRLIYQPYPGTEDFKIIMHSAHGLLPHLQFDQVEPFREIYRHASREEMLALLDNDGFLRIDTFFDKICRPALTAAFEKDGMLELVELLKDSQFRLLDFVGKMTDEHDYPNAFEGMRYEIVEARQSVENHQPIHWKEVIDDLMYTLNFHAELMPAEDHLLLQSKVMPFLMNVIAAMPLASGDTILALYDAGKLGMIPGRVTMEENQQPGITTVEIENEGRSSTARYQMFIDCSGQKPLELEDYPFSSLVRNGSVRRARASFTTAQHASMVPEEKKDRLFHQGRETVYHIGGVDIDGTYRLIGEDGVPNPRIYDIAFPHTTGLRPYSYGLQACSDTSAIVVRSWREEIKTGTPVEDTPEEMTGIYDKI